MKRCILVLVLAAFLVFPVSAMEFTAPPAPEAAQPYMPNQNETFGEGLWYIIKSAISGLRPDLAESARICLSLIAIVLLLSIVKDLTENASGSIRIVCAVGIGVLLLQPVNSMIQLGTATIVEMSEYTRLLLPVLTAAVAAQGGVTSSAALYTGTVFFITLLTTVISRLLVPALYVYLCLCVAGCAISQDTLKRLRDFVKWALAWCLKWILYIFTGYISLTGVISGTVDSSTLKAAKLTISGAVPVVGGILSDATETILVSAGAMKNAAGVYGIFAVLAVCVSPFLQIGGQYLLLKLSGAVCNIFGYKPAVTLVEDFSSGMGFVLAMTGTVCILLLISLVCFMKGMNG